MADSVCDYDAEFILKVNCSALYLSRLFQLCVQVALYTRCELNIRSTANFLLAYASNRHSCRPFLRKYFSASVRLPSDWIDVAEQYQVLALDLCDLPHIALCYLYIVRCSMIKPLPLDPFLLPCDA